MSFDTNKRAKKIQIMRKGNQPSSSRRQQKKKQTTQDQNIFNPNNDGSLSSSFHQPTNDSGSLFEYVSNTFGFHHHEGTDHKLELEVLKCILIRERLISTLKNLVLQIEIKSGDIQPNNNINGATALSSSTSKSLYYDVMANDTHFLNHSNRNNNNQKKKKKRTCVAPTSSITSISTSSSSSLSLESLLSIDSNEKRTTTHENKQKIKSSIRPYYNNKNKPKIYQPQNNRVMNNGKKKKKSSSDAASSTRMKKSNNNNNNIRKNNTLSIKTGNTTITTKTTQKIVDGSSNSKKDLGRQVLRVLTECRQVTINLTFCILAWRRSYIIKTTTKTKQQGDEDGTEDVNCQDATTTTTNNRNNKSMLSLVIPPRPFLWRDENYLLKVWYDLNFLSECKPLVKALRIPKERMLYNPLFLPNTLHNAIGPDQWFEQAQKQHVNQSSQFTGGSNITSTTQNTLSSKLKDNFENLLIGLHPDDCEISSSQGDVSNKRKERLELRKSEAVLVIEGRYYGNITYHHHHSNDTKELDKNIVTNDNNNGKSKSNDATQHNFLSKAILQLLNSNSNNDHCPHHPSQQYHFESNRKSLAHDQSYYKVITPSYNINNNNTTIKMNWQQSAYKQLSELQKPYCSRTTRNTISISTKKKQTQAPYETSIRCSSGVINPTSSSFLGKKMSESKPNYQDPYLDMPTKQSVSYSQSDVPKEVICFQNVSQKNHLNEPLSPFGISSNTATGHHQPQSFDNEMLRKDINAHEQNNNIYNKQEVVDAYISSIFPHSQLKKKKSHKVGITKSGRNIKKHPCSSPYAEEESSFFNHSTNITRTGLYTKAQQQHHLNSIYQKALPSQIRPTTTTILRHKPRQSNSTEKRKKMAATTPIHKMVSYPPAVGCEHGEKIYDGQYHTISDRKVFITCFQMKNKAKPYISLKAYDPSSSEEFRCIIRTPKIKAQKSCDSCECNDNNDENCNMLYDWIKYVLIPNLRIEDVSSSQSVNHSILTANALSHANKCYNNSRNNNTKTARKIHPDSLKKINRKKLVVLPAASDINYINSFLKEHNKNKASAQVVKSDETPKRNHGTEPEKVNDQQLHSKVERQENLVDATRDKNTVNGDDDYSSAFSDVSISTKPHDDFKTNPTAKAIDAMEVKSQVKTDHDSDDNCENDDEEYSQEYSDDDESDMNESTNE